MEKFVIFGSKRGTRPNPAHRVQSVSLHRFPVRCGLVYAGRPPAFDKQAPENREKVLLKSRAFSMNYRDKTLLLGLQLQPQHRFSPIGSDFVADVLEVGADVTDLKPGDRVMGDNHYEGRRLLSNGLPAGVPYNTASMRYRIIHRSKLFNVPPGMPDHVAAGFSINTQTAYSMVRKAKVQAGDKVLVTSARSNTSLSCINALRTTGADVYALTTSAIFTPRFRALGVREVITSEGITREAGKDNPFKADQGFFDLVIDPFFDLHLEHVVEVLRPFGIYYTCGLANSVANVEGADHMQTDMNSVMVAAIMKNLNINGNCLGLTSDLARAVEDYVEGRFAHMVDNVYSSSQEAAFLDRTYNDKARFGKVIYRYPE